MVQIENRTGHPLPAFTAKVLEAMFADYQRLVVKSKFTTGRSGSHVFLVRPIRQDDVPELPSVVKIDHHERIKQEWQAYKQCIQNRLPGVAEISGEPVYIHHQGSEFGGVRYPLVGSGTFDVVSFHTYYRQAEAADICYVLEEQLFKRLDALWRHKTVQPELHLHIYYDSFLPPNLVIEWSSLSPTSAQRLDPNTAHSQTFHSGETVEIVDFRVVRLLPDTAALVLDIPADVSGAYRFQVTAVLQVENYQVGQVIKQPLTGVIRQTRDEQLKEQVIKAFGANIDVTAETLTLANGDSLPNPLLALPRLLHHSLDNAHVASIHADLNLQNILVEPQNRNAYLIDFVNARQDHVLRDLLHLEMAIVTGLIPEALVEADLAPEIMIPFYERLHCVHFYPNQIAPPAGLEKPFAVLQTIRRAAHHYLSELGNWTEYYYGLIFYLLGALRYKDLDKIPMAKQVAFWGAAVTLKIREKPPSCAEMLGEQTPDTVAKMSPEKRESESRRIQTETHFHGPVAGAIHTGSGDINITDAHKTEGSAPGLETGPKTRYRDTFSSYEIGAQRLLAQMGQNHPRYLEALGYQDRLRGNIDRSRRFGDTGSRKSDRAEIVEQLNELSLSVTGTSFNELCQETG